MRSLFFFFFLRRVEQFVPSCLDFSGELARFLSRVDTPLDRAVEKIREKIRWKMNVRGGHCVIVLI